MVGMKDKTVYIIGKWISFSREQIDQTYNLNEMKNGSKFKKLVKEPDFQKMPLGKEKMLWREDVKILMNVLNFKNKEDCNQLMEQIRHVIMFCKQFM